ncbi:unnamed protein product [Mytilus coruscus]|uniref:Uncharacterized protein n=1 Tax=Mytilus coruscus TaxID=42192 RepID=A0A6J8EDA1_MYTCO|nr:unnamed protein product [Mytilus coruscus]
MVLDSNNIFYLNISGVNRIRYLYVKKKTQLTEINHGIFLNSHSTLVSLELSYNALDDDVWNVLVGVTSLRILKLKQNRLQIVSPSVLTRLSELDFLDLSHNYISSLTDVLLRSGKMSYVLFNSNKLVNFQPNLIHDTYTFRDNSYCKLDISYNMMDSFELNMPTTSTRLTLNLGQIELTDIHFKTNDRGIESLNISSNRLVTLSETLPKAKRYIISNNPLTTTNVLKYLTTTMKDATQIEMDDIDFLCNRSEHYNYTNLQFSKISNELAPHPSTSIGLWRPIPGLELKDNLIYCDCDVLFLRNNTLITQKRCSFPPEFERYLVSCFFADNCVGNDPIYVYKETKSICLNDDYFDINISMLKVDKILSVGWKRLGSKKQVGVQMIAYSEQIIVKEVLMIETGQTNSFFLQRSLNANRECTHAFLKDRTFEQRVDINQTKITGKSKSVSETNSNKEAVYGTSAVLVLSILLNIFGSFFYICVLREKGRQMTPTQINLIITHMFEMSSGRRSACDQH